MENGRREHSGGFFVPRLATLLFSPYVILLCEVVVFYRQVLFSSRFAIPWDLRYYHFPIASFMASAFRSGELPLWNPYIYCGFPQYANIQSQTFYPPTVLAILVSNWTGGKNLLYFLELQLIAHVLLGGVFAYWLLRRLSVGRFGALIAATIFQLGGFFASQTQHIGAVNAGAWMPLAWLGVISLGRRFDWRWAALLAFSLAMALLGGFTAVTAVVFVSCVHLALCLVLLRLRPPHILGYLVLSCLWALLLVSIQILPTAELTQNSIAALRSQWQGSGGGMPPQSFISLVLPNRLISGLETGTYSLPWNPTFLYLYCGIPCLLFSLRAVVYRANRYGAVFLVIIGLSALWLLGEHTPVGRVTFLLLPSIIKAPLYAEFALPEFVLGMAVLAGLGADSFLGSKGVPVRAGILLLTAADLIAAGSGRPINTADVTQEPGLAYEHFDGEPEIPHRMRQLVNASVPPARIDTMKGSPQWNNGASLFEIPTAGGDDPFALIRLLKVRLLFCEGFWWTRSFEVSALDSSLLDFMNVRYVLSMSPLPTEILGRANFVKKVDFGRQQAYENQEVMPRFFLVKRIRRVSGREEGLELMRSPEFNVRTEAIVEGDVDFINSAEPLGNPGSLQVLKYTSRNVILETDSPAPAYLVSSEAYYPGWRASIDGKERVLRTTNVAFRGMPVPAGRHKVTMTFAPSILWRSAILTAAAWLLLIWAIQRPRFRFT